MKFTTVEEYELISFFETEPTKLDENIAWPYNKFIFTHKQNNLKLNFSIEPSSKAVELILLNNDSELYHLIINCLVDLKLLKDNKTEVLELLINSSESIQIKLKPVISILHQL